MVDREGVIHAGRLDLNRQKEFTYYAQKNVADAMKTQMYLLVYLALDLLHRHDKSMSQKPVVFALSNPDPKFHGRSDANRRCNHRNQP